MELQKPFRRQFLGAWILWIMQYFSKLMKDDPQWNVKLYSENEFENVIKVVRGEKWQFYMCCILPLFSPAKLGGESDQEEKLAATLDKTFFQLQTFAKMFLSLIHTSYKKLTTILQVTYRLDTPIDYPFLEFLKSKIYFLHQIFIKALVRPFKWHIGKVCSTSRKNVTLSGKSGKKGL